MNRMSICLCGKINLKSNSNERTHIRKKHITTLLNRHYIKFLLHVQNGSFIFIIKKFFLSSPLFSYFQIACNKNDGIERLFTEKVLVVRKVRVYRDLCHFDSHPCGYTNARTQRVYILDEKIIAYLIHRSLYTFISLQDAAPFSNRH